MKDKPVLTPLQELFSSRKFLLAVAFIISELLLRAIPDLRPYIADLSQIIFLGLGLPFLHLSVEDLVKVWHDKPTTLADAQRLIIGEAVEKFIPPAGTTLTSGTTNTSTVSITADALDTAKG